MKMSPEFADGRGIPTKTLGDRLTVGQGDERVELYYFGRGHTDGDIWVFFPTARVLYEDVFSAKEMPIIDGAHGGSGIEIVKPSARQRRRLSVASIES